MGPDPDPTPDQTPFLGDFKDATKKIFPRFFSHNLPAGTEAHYLQS
jgi:hypothetical protein